MDGNFVSVNEAIEFFFARGFETIHYMGAGRIMMHMDTRLIMHIAPKGDAGVAAYEITADQLQDMLEQMDYAERDRSAYDYMDDMALTGRAA